MKNFLKLAFVFTLIAFISADAIVDTSTLSNFNDIRQSNLELNLFIDMDNKSVTGQAKLTLVALTDFIKKVVLDSNDITINEVFDQATRIQLNFKYDVEHKWESLGTPIVIELNRSLRVGEKVHLEIFYTTSKTAASIQWLTPDQTEGGVYPYMYTQNEPIYSRSLVPCQDTPAAKIPIKASLTCKKPFTAVFGGLLVDKVDNNDNTTTFNYEQTVPIPTYLIAIAVGNLKFLQLTDVPSCRSGVWSEPEMVEKAQNEFKEDTENYIKAAEAYMFNYEWKRFDILVLPKAFPYGGMENPNLTFATPSLIAGDRSLTNVVAHELAHSWTGNLVTNNSWDNFWLNEGFTVFFERKIVQKVYSNDLRLLESQIGYAELIREIKNIGVTDNYTSLYPRVGRKNPDDAFSTVPYEKGFTLLFYLENLVGEADFQTIFVGYISKFRYLSVQSSDFIDFFTTKLKEIRPTDADAILAKINWNGWLYKAGYPIEFNDYTSPLADVVNSSKNTFFNGEMDDNFPTTFKNWMSKQKELFLNQILNEPITLNSSQIDYLTYTLDLKSYNMEVEFLWISILLKTNNKDQNGIAEAEAFLLRSGRMKFVKPLFLGIFDIDPQRAKDLLTKNEKLYHSLVVNMLKKEFAKREKKVSKFLDI